MSTANFGTLYRSALRATQSDYPRQLQLGLDLIW